jgi:phage terminase small subunit
MPALTNRRREIFAMSVASGVTLLESALAAGYAPSRAQITGSELGRNSKVSVRITELREAIAKAITRHTSYSLLQAMFEANEALELARKNSQPGQMIAATTLKARLCGLLIERRQIDYRDMTELSDAELESLIGSVDSSSDTGFTH